MRKFQFTPEGRAAFLNWAKPFTLSLGANEIEDLIDSVERDVCDVPPPPFDQFVRTIAALNGITMVLSTDWFVEVVSPEEKVPLPSEFLLDYMGTPKPPEVTTLTGTGATINLKHIEPAGILTPIVPRSDNAPQALPEWTPNDDNLLALLLERKAAHDARKHSEHREALAQVLTEIGGVLPPESVVDKLIAGADKLIAALQPFSKGA